MLDPQGVSKGSGFVAFSTSVEATRAKPLYVERRAQLQDHNGKFSYGYASSLGKRSTMEYFYETRIDGVDGEIVGLFGVFDG
ncbi:unnamed protein product [Camellia sinensis]